MAAAMIMRPSWPSVPPVGHHAGQPDQVLPDQGPAQAAMGELAVWPRGTRGNTLLGGIVPGAITIG